MGKKLIQIKNFFYYVILNISIRKEILEKKYESGYIGDITYNWIINKRF